MAIRKAKDPVKNRADVARHRARRKERTSAIFMELCQYVKPEPIHDDDGKLNGYAYRVQVPEDFYQRFEELAQEHGRTAKQLLDETMVVYFEEKQRLKDEQN